MLRPPAVSLTTTPRYRAALGHRATPSPPSDSSATLSCPSNVYAGREREREKVRSLLPMQSSFGPSIDEQGRERERTRGHPNEITSRLLPLPLSHCRGWWLRKLNDECGTAAPPRARLSSRIISTHE